MKYSHFLFSIGKVEVILLKFRNYTKTLWEGEPCLKYADARYRKLNTLNAFFSTQILYDDVVPGTLTSQGTSIYWEEKRTLNDTEYRRMSTFPTDYDFCGIDARYICGMSVPPFMIARIANEIKMQWFD